MKTLSIGMTLAAGILAAALSAHGAPITEVTVEVTASTPGQVQGRLTNTSMHPVVSTELLIRREFIYEKEFEAPEDDPSRADYVTVPERIPPGATVPFVVHVPPLPVRTDGTFEIRASVTAIAQEIMPTPARGAAP